MKQLTAFIILSVCLFIGACATTPQGRATQLVVISDGVADEVSTQWDEQGHDRIVKCREEGHETPEARVECMGVFHAFKDTLEALLEGLIVAQTAVKLAVKCDSLESCKDEPDWKALEAKLLEAIAAIRPILQEIRK